MSDDIQSIKKPLNLAMKYLSYQPRTVYEMKKYMERKGIEENDKGKIIKILLENNYLNDLDFAKLFIESRIKNKPKSKFAFRFELKKKGVTISIIDDILSQYSDQELAIKSVKSKLRLWRDFDHDQLKKKMINYLRYRGFTYDICLSTLNYFRESRD